MIKKKNSPIIILLVLIVIALLGAIAIRLLSSKNSSQESTSQPQNAFTSIRDALSKSISLECKITDSQGRVTNAYIKNGAVRADMVGQDPKDSGSIIMKDKVLYLWNSEGAFKMSLPDNPNAMNESSGGSNQGNQLLDDLDNYKNNCKVSSVSDSLFVPPTDVNFSDMSEMMKSGKPSEEEIKELMNKYQNKGS